MIGIIRMSGFWSLMCWVGVIFAQSNAEIENPDFVSFVNVYFAQKEKPGIDEAKVRSWLEKYEMSLERYGEILKSGLQGRELNLTLKEETAFKEIHDTNEKDRVTNTNHVKSLCARENISYDNYLVLLNRYRTSTAFQHQLRPIISEYILKRN